LLLCLPFGCAEDTIIPGDEKFIRISDPRPIGLPTPVLSIGFGIETGFAALSWRPVPGAASYRLANDLFPDFGAPLDVFTGSGLYFELGYANQYLVRYYYRVRAENADAVSDWSNAVAFP
jgi:hypothetical protein